MDQQPATATTLVCLDVPLVAGEQETEVLDGQLRYDAADPFAVTLLVRTGAGAVPWTFARELLADGLYEPAGVGDVQVWPCLSTEAEAIVVVELHAPGGDALLQVPSRLVARFVAAMFARVPAGQETALLSLDSELDQILA